MKTLKGKIGNIQHIQYMPVRTIKVCIIFWGIRAYGDKPKALVCCIQKTIRKAQDNNRMKAIEWRRNGIDWESASAKTQESGKTWQNIANVCKCPAHACRSTTCNWCYLALLCLTSFPSFSAFPAFVGPQLHSCADPPPLQQRLMDNFLMVRCY